MKIIQDDLWLCTDCLMAAVNNDYTGLDYYYKESEATKRMEEIQAGLEKLGPHLVPFFNTEEENGYWCSDCNSYHYSSEMKTAIDNFDDEVPACPDCCSDDVSEIGNGHQEFSHDGCDCCGSWLAGELHRFAVLGEDSEVN